MKISATGSKRAIHFPACIVLVALIAALSWLAPPTASAATPDQFTGLNMWMKADTSVTLTSGAVSGWVDQSANHTAFTPFTGSNVTVLDNIINGHRAVHFDGSSSLVSDSGSQAPYALTNKYHWFVVMNTNAVNTSGTGYEMHGAFMYGSTYGFTTYPEQSRIWALTNIGGPSGYNYTYSNSDAITLNRYSVLEISFDGTLASGNIKYYKNGQPWGVATWPGDIDPPSWGTMCIGGAGNPPGPYTYHLIGDIAEIVTYNTTLDATGRQGVGQYLAEKYNLPGYGHDPLAGVMPDGAHLKVWLDATKGVTTDGSGNVTKWVSQALTYDDFVPVVGSGLQVPPTLVPSVAGFNGKPALRFNGYSALRGPGANFGTNATWIVVGKFDDYSGRTQEMIGKYHMPTTYHALGYYLNYPGNRQNSMYIYTTASFTPASSVGCFNWGQYAIFSLSFDGTLASDNVKFYIDDAPAGTATQTGTHYQDSTYLLYIGGTPFAPDDPTSGQYSGDVKGDIAEVVMYDSTLSAADRATVMSYLKTKYGIGVVVTAVSPGNYAVYE